MLSRELKDLEINQLIKRTISNTQPIGVEYELTDYGHTLEHIVKHYQNGDQTIEKRLPANRTSGS